MKLLPQRFWMAQSWEHLAMSGDMFGCHKWGRGVRGATGMSEQRPRRLLKIGQCPGCPYNKELFGSHVNSVRNPDIRLPFQIDSKTSSLSKCADQNQRNKEKDPNIHFFLLTLLISFAYLQIKNMQKHMKANMNSSAFFFFFSWNVP